MSVGNPGEPPRRARSLQYWSLCLGLMLVAALVLSACGGGGSSSSSSETESSEPAGGEETTAGGGEEKEEEGGGGSEEASGEPLVFANLEGAAVEGGGDFTKGVEIASKKINAEGGVEGRPIEVKKIPKGLTPEEGVSAYKQAQAEGALVAFLGGPSGTDAVAAQAAREKVPLMELSGNYELVEPPQPYVYSLSWDTEYPSSVVRWLVENKGAKKIALLHFTTDYSEGIPHSIEQACEELGCELVDNETGELEASVEELTPQLTKMKNSGAEAYYIETINPNAAKAARQLGMFDKPIISEQWLSVPAIAEATGSAGENIVFAAQKCLEPKLAEPSDPQRKFCETYRDEFAKAYPGEPYALFSVYGADAVNAFARAAEQAMQAGEEVTPEAMNEQLENITGELRLSHGVPETSPEQHHVQGPFETGDLLYEIQVKGKEIKDVLAKDASPKGAKP